jgi:hypothetical protein
VHIFNLPWIHGTQYMVGKGAFVPLPLIPVLYSRSVESNRFVYL